MASDGIVAIFGVPMLVLLLVSGFAYLFIDKRSITPKTFSSFGFKRFVLGYCGVVFALFVWSCVMGVSIGFGKVQLGHITYDELRSLIIGYCFYMFAFVGPFILIGALIVGVPSISLLTKFKRASYFGLSAFVAICCLSLTIFMLAGTSSGSCSSNLPVCFFREFSSILFPIAVISLGFAAGARLPMWKN